MTSRFYGRPVPGHPDTWAVEDWHTRRTTVIQVLDDDPIDWRIGSVAWDVARYPARAVELLVKNDILLPRLAWVGRCPECGSRVPLVGHPARVHAHALDIAMLGGDEAYVRIRPCPGGYRRPLPPRSVAPTYANPVYTTTEENP